MQLSAASFISSALSVVSNPSPVLLFKRLTCFVKFSNLALAYRLWLRVYVLPLWPTFSLSSKSVIEATWRCRVSSWYLLTGQLSRFPFVVYVFGKVGNTKGSSRMPGV